MGIYKDAHYRSIIKSLSWRVFATLSTILIVFAFTRKLVLSLGVGAVEIVVKLILYYFHERIWGVIPFGRKKHPLSDLSVSGPVKKEDIAIIKEKLRQLGYISEE
jgi:adenylylsulfate kinase